MMGIMVPKTRRASNKICDKYHLLHLVGILFPHINDDARSELLQICAKILLINYLVQMSKNSYHLFSPDVNVYERCQRMPGAKT